MLMWLSALGRHSITRWEEGVGEDVLQRAKTSDEWSPGGIWGRSTVRNEGLQAGLPSVFMPWASASDWEVSTGSKPPFNPLGYTTWSPHCNSWCTSSWKRHPTCSYLVHHQSWCWDAPLCWEAHLEHLHWTAQKCRPNYHQSWWAGWVLLPPHPRKRSMPGMGEPIPWSDWMPSLLQWFFGVPIRRKARSPQNFLASPHVPEQERAKSLGES